MKEFPHKRVPFGGLVVATPHLWGEIPPKNSHFGDINKLSTFKPNVLNNATCILSKVLHQFQPHFAQQKDHQVFILRGPNIHPTNPIKINKTLNRHISAVHNRSTDFNEIGMMT